MQQLRENAEWRCAIQTDAAAAAEDERDAARARLAEVEALVDKTWLATGVSATVRGLAPLDDVVGVNRANQLADRAGLARAASRLTKVEAEREKAEWKYAIQTDAAAAAEDRAVIAEAELARVKAEAEGLRAALADAQESLASASRDA